MSGQPNKTADTPEISDVPAAERRKVLAVERRWLALDILGGKTTPVGLRELAEEIAAREAGSDAADEEAIDRVAISLYHSHLPKMVDAGVLDYDPESHRIDPEGVPARLAMDPPSNGPTNWFAAVADQQRQLVLEALAQTELTTLEELSTTLAGEDTPPVDTPIDAIATQLHHNHLPRLDDLGLVHYDPDARVIEATERTVETVRYRSRPDFERVMDREGSGLWSC